MDMGMDVDADSAARQYSSSCRAIGADRRAAMRQPTAPDEAVARQDAR